MLAGKRSSSYGESHASAISVRRDTDGATPTEMLIRNCLEVLAYECHGMAYSWATHRRHTFRIELNDVTLIIEYVGNTGINKSVMQAEAHGFVIGSATPLETWLRRYDVITSPVPAFPC